MLLVQYGSQSWYPIEVSKYYTLNMYDIITIINLSFTLTTSILTHNDWIVYLKYTIVKRKRNGTQEANKH